MSIEPSSIRIITLSASALAQHLDALAALLHACVVDGASIGFVMPYTPEQAGAYWRDKVSPGVQHGGVTMLLALQGDALIGTVQLDHDTPANQAHRAEVRKLLVHPLARRQGVGRLLMQAIEPHAVRLGRSLLTLDTRTGDNGEPLYRSLGYQVAGMIPRYCRDTYETRLDATTIMYKDVVAPVQRA